LESVFLLVKRKKYQTFLQIVQMGFDLKQACLICEGITCVVHNKMITLLLYNSAF